MAIEDQKTFSVKISLQQPNGKAVELWDPTKPPISDPDPGVYAGNTTGAALHTSQDGKQSIKVTVALDSGVETDIYLGLDFSKAGNPKKMATALASVGLPVEQLAAQKEFEIQPGFFLGPDLKGRPCHVIVKAVEGVDAKGRKKLNDKEFATEDQAKQYREALANGKAPGAATTSTAGGNGATPPAAADAQNALANLFGKGK